jgi:hypothetical protein
MNFDDAERKFVRKIAAGFCWGDFSDHLVLEGEMSNKEHSLFSEPTNKVKSSALIYRFGPRVEQDQKITIAN